MPVIIYDDYYYHSDYTISIFSIPQDGTEELLGQESPESEVRESKVAKVRSTSLKNHNRGRRPLAKNIYLLLDALNAVHKEIPRF